MPLDSSLGNARLSSGPEQTWRVHCGPIFSCASGAEASDHCEPPVWAVHLPYSTRQETCTSIAHPSLSRPPANRQVSIPGSIKHERAGVRLMYRQYVEIRNVDPRLMRCPAGIRCGIRAKRHPSLWLVAGRSEDEVKTCIRIFFASEQAEENE